MTLTKACCSTTEPYVPLTNAEKQRRWRKAHPLEHSMNVRRYRARLKNKLRPFIGIDGEGGGTDAQGRQHYLLMHATGSRGGWIDRELFRDNRRLSTAECLDFILALPKEAILVGYFFSYDATQILRDLPPSRIDRLLADRDPAQGGGRYTYWGRYAIEFVPRQYFRVALIMDNGHGKGVVKGSARTVNEVGGFFQKSFVEALKSWEIGDSATLDFIGANKEQRSSFELMTAQIREYCRTECRQLSQLMDRLRDACIAADCVPVQWRGAGAIAASLYHSHGMLKRKDRPARPAALDGHATQAYYGGRFEIAQVGCIPGPVYEYDINSAYPAGFLKLPCPLHTKWRRFKGGSFPNWDTPFAADIQFEHPKGLNLCCFPIRQKGRLYWPRRGNGIYWSPEIAESLHHGVSINFFGGWQAIVKCDCHAYDWVAEIYEFRKSLGKSTKGFALKLGINSLYGKMAQRLGGAPYRDMIAAGLTTSYTRAQLMEAYRGKDSEIVMLATDGVFATVPLDVEIGAGLGQWESKLRADGMFIVQPGVYWSPGSDQLPRTRGIPRSAIIAQRSDFERVFDEWCRGDGTDDAPTVKVPVNHFVGHRLAACRLPPVLAGQWITETREISFDWGKKRAVTGDIRSGRILTAPWGGHPGLRSEAYDPAALSDLQAQQLLEEAAPDFVQWGHSDE